MDKALITEYFRDPPILFTKRLILRKILKSDADDVFEYSSDPEVTRYLLWDPHQNYRYTVRYLSYLQTRYRAGEFHDWALILKDTGKMIGTCGFTAFDLTNNSAEVGYVLNRAYWHKGIAAEALSAVINFGFNELSLFRIEAKFMAGNVNSRRVMEKVGMSFEGINRGAMLIKGKYTSIGVCSILANEYFSGEPKFY